MKYKKLPDVHCLNCSKVVQDNSRDGYLRYFCDECLQINKEKNEFIQSLS